MCEVQAGGGLQDRGGRREEPIGEHDEPGDARHRLGIAAETAGQHVEGGANARAEQNRRRQYVQPFDNEVGHG